MAVAPVRPGRVRAVLLNYYFREKSRNEGGTEIELSDNTGCSTRAESRARVLLVRNQRNCVARVAG